MSIEALPRFEPMPLGRLALAAFCRAPEQEPVTGTPRDRDYGAVELDRQRVGAGRNLDRRTYDKLRVRDMQQAHIMPAKEVVPGRRQLGIATRTADSSIAGSSQYRATPARQRCKNNAGHQPAARDLRPSPRRHG